MTSKRTSFNRRDTLRLIGAAGASAAFGGVAPAQGKPWAEIVEAAKKEGSVTLYSAHSLVQLNELVTRFKNDTGLTLTYVRSNDADLTARVNTERETNRPICDILVDTNVVGVKQRGKAGQLETPVGPAFDNPDYDKKDRVPENTYFEINATILTFSWNKELFAKGMKDYPDCIDPSLAGKIGIPGLVAPAYFDFYQFLEERYGVDFIKKLAALKPRIYPSALPMAQAVVSGEIAVGLSTQPLIDEAQKGAPVGWGLAPKVWGARFYGNILKNAPKPNAAQVLANYMVTKPAQEALARVTTSPLPNISTAVGNTRDVRHLNVEKMTPDFMNTYREEWRKLFQQS